MKITRNGVEIELTAEEIEKAYREQEYNYRIQDAKNQFYNFVGYIPDYDGYDDCEDIAIDNEDALKDFEKKYNIHFADITDENSDNYLLDEFLKEYEHLFNCDIPENDNWQYAIECVLEKQI